MRVSRYFVWLFFITLSSTIISYAQEKSITVRGKVYDNVNFEKLEGVTISIKGTNIVSRSDLNGEFSILAQPTDSLIFTYSFYKSKIVSVFNQTELNVPLEKQVILLDEVVAKGNKRAIQFKADRIIVDLKKINKTGRTLVDVLRLMPTIKTTDSGLNILGKSSTLVYIGDRLIRMTGQALIDYLNSLPTDLISNVEIISTPPSQYEASGNIGIIRLTADSGMMSGWKASLNGGIMKNSYASAMLSSFGGYYTPKIDFEGLVFCSSNNQLNQSDYTSFFSEATIRTFNPKKWSNNGLEAVLTMNYKINKTNNLLLNLQLPIYDSENVRDIDNVTEYHNKRAYQSIDSILYSTGTAKKRTYLYAIDAIYKYSFSKQNNLSIALGYVNNSVMNNREWLSEVNRNNVRYNPELYNTSGRMRHNILTSQIDANYTLHGFNFTSGYKLSYITTDSKSSLSRQKEILQSFSDFFQYTESTNALHSSVDKAYANWLIKIGLRVELTHTNGSSISQNSEHKNRLFHLFPTLYVGYSIPKHRFSIAYSKRIDRPSYSYLDPFKWFISKYDYAVGNPFLKPAITHLLDFRYLYGDRFSGRVHASKVVDKIGRFVVLDSEDYKKQVQMTDNFLDEYSCGLNLYYKLNHGILETTLSGDVSFSKFVSKKSDFKNTSGWSSSISMNNTLFFNSNFMLNINILNDFPSVLNYRRMENMFRTDIGFIYRIDKHNIVLSLSANDIFKIYKSNYCYYSNSVRQEYVNYYDSRSVKFSVTWKFGDWNKKQISKKRLSNTEEKERL